VTNVNAPPEVIVQTPVVVDVNIGVRPEEAVAVKVGVVPKVCAPGGLKVMVCVALGVTEEEAVDAAPEPLAFLAVTVKVYAVPFVSPVTVSGLPAPVAVKPPGLDVTV
jgi:autonomous glycyl radical cofactor GrcA